MSAVKSIIVKRLSSFAAILSMGPTHEFVFMNVYQSAVEHGALFLNWRFVHHITVNLGYLAVKYDGNNIVPLRKENNNLYFTLSGILNLIIYFEVT